jgi:hypothetical protein
MDNLVGDPTVGAKNRERLLHGDLARAFFERVLAPAKARELLSAEHFTVDGTLIEAWAGLKSFNSLPVGCDQCSTSKLPQPARRGLRTGGVRNERAPSWARYGE